MPTQTSEIDEAERRLKKVANIHRKNEERRKLSYESVVGEIRDASKAGLSYDRIAAVTDLSKTQIARILRA